MSGHHASIVTRCDNRADFDACPCSGYSITAGSLFDAAFPYRAFTPGSNILLNMGGWQSRHVGGWRRGCGGLGTP